jgi:AcrR family transcriptional regulator
MNEQERKAADAEAVRERRKARRAQEKARQIVRSAKGIFLANDYGNVTVDLIAEAADMSRATVYQYFKTKAEIYGGVLYEDMNTLATALEEAYSRERGVAENIRRMTGAYVRFFEKHPEYFGKLSFFFFPGREERLPEEIAVDLQRRLQEGIAVVEACIRAGIEQGEVRTQDPRSAAVALWGLWMGVTYQAVAGQTERLGRSFEAVYRNGVENFLYGLTVPAPPEGRP